MAEKRPGVKELRALPAVELQGHVQSLRQELWEHRVKAKQGALQQTHLLRALRRQIARIQTVLSEQT